MDQAAPDLLSRLRAAISDLAAPDNGRLPPERALAAELGVGRRALRAALEVLEAEGLIWRRQGKGTFVGREPDPHGLLAAGLADETDMQAVMEARLCIEPTLASLAALRATPAEVDELRRLAREAASSGNPAWEAAMHLQIARLGRNRPLLTAFQFVDALARRLTSNLAHPVHDPSSLVEAVASRDPAAARRAMKQHLRRLAKDLGGAEQDAGD